MPNLNILEGIELTEKQVKALNEELNSWKTRMKAQITEAVRSEVKTEFDVKLRKINEEKAAFMKEQESLVEEIKTKMQKVMVKRFTDMAKEMYDQLKVEARKDVLNDPRITALEEIKNITYPLMDETVTRGYVDELAKALKMIESKENEIDKLKARIKLKEIVSTLSPIVAEAVETFIGDPVSEEEVVEKYAKLKNLVAETKKKKEGCDDEEDSEDDEDLEDEEDMVAEEGDGDASEGSKEDDEYKGKRKGKTKNESKNDDDDDDDDDDDEDEEDAEDMDEDLEIKPTVHFDRKDKKVKDYIDTLNEMLDLAGVPKE